MKIPIIALASTAVLAGVAYKKIIAPALEDAPPRQTGDSNLDYAKKSLSHVMDSILHGKRPGPETQKPAGVATGKPGPLDEFKEAAGVQLTTAEHVLTDFKSKLNSADDEVKSRYQKVVDQLEKRGKKLKTALAEMKEDGKVKWEDMKRAFNEEFSMYNEELRGLSLDETEA